MLRLDSPRLLLTLLACLVLGWAGCSDDDGPPPPDMGSEAGTDGQLSDTVPTGDGLGDTGTSDMAGDAVAPDGAVADGGAQPDASTTTGTWVQVPKGTFAMGSPANEACRKTNETQHDVTLTRDFEIWSREVTQGEIQAALGFNPSSKTACGAACPVDSVTWSHAAAYCNKLSQDASLGPCYDCTGTGAGATCGVATAYSGGSGTIYDCLGYRLPTEAEWEYAYRAGTTTALYNADLVETNCSGPDANADAIGWYSKNASGTTHPVGLKTPNAWGLYDMAGNLQEWVNDAWQANLGSNAVTDPSGPGSGTQSAIRGGSWAHGADDMRAAHRKPNTRANTGSGIGFRCVRSL